MNNQTVSLLIAIGVLLAIFFVIPANERFDGSTVPYTSSGSSSGSSVDCKLFPKDPACQPLPPVSPVEADIQSCAPADGQWSIPSPNGSRSKLASPCCQPPKYELGKEKAYKTCDDKLDPTNPIEACVANCCKDADSEANNYDSSWYPMARCACSLWCYNQDVPHFQKYGTAVHYITGDIAEAQTGDSPNYIGEGDFSGGV